MPSWFFSLQFRMAFAFALVLGLALLGVSLYVGYTAKQATIQFERDVEEAKAARIEQLISDYYAATSGWGGLQPAVEHASSLYGVNIVVKDASGDVIADSRLASSGGSAAPMTERYNLPVLSSGREVGSVALAPSIAPLEVPEPSVSILASALNQSLFWKGLAAGIAGIVCMSLLSRRMLGPVRSLGSAARLLGQGDLSQRVT